MDLWDAGKLALFIWFAVPGFISIKFYQLLFPAVQKSSSELVVDAICYSCINYALFSWTIFWVESHKLLSVHPWLYYLAYVFLLFVSPLLLVLVWKMLRSTARFQASLAHPTAKPWDFVFGQRKSYWVHVHLIDGKRISGLYHEQSFSSSAPATEQIYLEQVWVVNDDGAFERMVGDSAGAIISSDRINYIELIDYKG